MKEIRKLLLISFLTILSSPAVFAQKSSPVPLRNILDDLEVKFAITFSYLDENVEGILLKPPPEDNDLEGTLLYLNENSDLDFRQLTNDNISISKPEEEKIDVCGYLLDAETQNPLYGATIQFEKGHTISDQNGYFTLEGINANTVLLIRSLGYQPNQVNASSFKEAECASFYMEIRPSTLKEIIVPDYLTMGINKKVDGSYALNTQSLGILPGLIEPDLLHSIQTLPGIQSINETVSDINVRGGTNDQNLVLWDGIRMYQSGHFFGLISVFNPYLTKEIDLIKNGSTASLGDAVSSTISIQTDDEIGEIISGGAGLNMLYADAFIKVPLSDKASINISGRRSIGDVLETPTYTQYFSRAFRDSDVFNSSPGADSLATSEQRFYFYDVNLNFNYNISSKDQLRFNLLNILNEIEFQENAVVNNITESRTSRLYQQSLAGNLTYSRLWNPKLRTSTLFYFSKYNLDALNVNLFEDQRLIQENEVLDFGLKIDSRVTISNYLDLFMGYQLYEIGVSNLEDINNPDFRRLIKSVLINHSVFVEANYVSQTNTNLTGGLRVNYLDKFNKWIWEPRISFNQKFMDYFSLELLGEFKSQSITQLIDFQTDFLGIEKRRWVLSNDDDIPVIQSKQASAGILFNKNDILLSTEVYIKHVEGINSLSQGFQNQFQFERTSGNYKARGIDLLLSRKFGKFDSWTSYSYAKNTFEFPDLIPPSFPNNLDITHTVSLGANYHSKKLELSIGFNWHTGKPYTQPSESEPVIEGAINYKLPNSSRLEDYLRFDFSAIYNYSIGNHIRSQLGLSAWNIVDRENIINAYYILDNNDMVQIVEQEALAFTPNIMVRFYF